MPTWMPDTKSQRWEEAGLAAQLIHKNARRARIDLALVLVLIAGVLVAQAKRDEFFGDRYDIPVRIVAALLLVMLGYRLARDAGRVLGPALLRRLEPGTAGTVGFLVRMTTIGLALLVALRVAGLQPSTLAVGGAVTGVIVGLAAQQTFGNFISGLVLLSARPFRVGDRVRLLGGNVNGQLEATVSGLGILYSTFIRNGERILIPNNIVMQLAVMPINEPTAVDLRARLSPGTRPTDVQHLLGERITVATRGVPRIDVEEINDDEVVVRVTATPRNGGEGRQLADEVLAALSEVTGSDGAVPA